MIIISLRPIIRKHASRNETQFIILVVVLSDSTRIACVSGSNLCLLDLRYSMIHDLYVMIYLFTLELLDF